MLSSQSQNTKKSLFKKVRKQRLNYITVLPSLVTLMNGVSGFAAIIFASKAGSAANQMNIYSGNFPFLTVACYMIGLAMIADVLDGRLARMSHNTSSFGGQLDSLCDVISFGVAPAVIMLKFMEVNMGRGTAADVFISRFLWLTAAVYLGCAAIRLARFNVENEEDESSHMSFYGLPSPAAAGVIASLILFNQYLVSDPHTRGTLLSNIGHNTIVITLPFITIGIAVLMISRLKYPHLLNRYLKGRKPFAYLVWSIILILLIVFIFEIAAAALFCGLAASGPVRWIYSKIRAHKKCDGDSDTTIAADPN